MTDDLLPIHQITDAMIANVVRESLTDRGDPRPLRDFLRRVDWSRMGEQPSTQVTMLVANLDSWTRQLAEQRLTRPQFVTRLLGTLPAHEASALRDGGSLGLSARRKPPAVRPRQRDESMAER